MLEKLLEKFKEQIVEYKKNDLIFEEGAKCTDLYIIIEGQVLVYVRKDVETVIPLTIVNSGAVFGEFSFFDGNPRSANAKAATDVKVIKIPRSAKESNLHKIPSWVTPVLQTVLERIRDVNELMKRNIVVDDRLKEKFHAMSDLNL
jgi:CRP-like cAMP-binding protein